MAKKTRIGIRDVRTYNDKGQFLTLDSTSSRQNVALSQNFQFFLNVTIRSRHKYYYWGLQSQQYSWFQLYIAVLLSLSKIQRICLLLWVVMSIQTLLHVALSIQRQKTCMKLEKGATKVFPWRWSGIAQLVSYEMKCISIEEAMKYLYWGSIHPAFLENSSDQQC